MVVGGSYCSAPVLYSVYDYLYIFFLFFFVLFCLDLLRIKKPDLGRYYHLPAPTRLHRIWTIAPHRESVYYFLSVRRRRLFFFYFVSSSVSIYTCISNECLSLFFLLLSICRWIDEQQQHTSLRILLLLPFLCLYYCRGVYLPRFLSLSLSTSSTHYPPPPPEKHGLNLLTGSVSLFLFLCCALFRPSTEPKLVRDRHRRPRPSLARPTDTAATRKEK